ncbi:restriction endonuclease subunit S [Streptomyces sp. NK08204]|uniref:restriction endonuclease subunit S n=1 Tax=Streptomyces sp. NK08204 TaxID=2873260 RepID=UPI001CEC23D3|nr:restriction endonuclease subunit S [Streptomyces sp. NK08204]
MREVPFGDLLSEPLRNGVSYPTRLRGTGVPMVNMGEAFAYDVITDQECERAPLTGKKRERFLLQEGDLLFVRQSLKYEGAGHCVYVGPGSGPRTWESHLIRARIKESLADPRFYYYYFRSPAGRRNLGTIIHQVAAAGIRGSELGGLRVPFPPLPQQRAIAAVLTALDDKAEANARITDSADEILRLLYRRALSEPGAHELPLFDALDITFGVPFASSCFNSEEVGRPLLRIRDLKTFRPRIWTTQRLDKELLVAPGETVAGMDAQFRPVFWLGEPALLNQRVLHARSLVGGGPALCREALRGPLAEVEHYKTGTTVAHLNKRDLTALTVRVPGPDAVASFAAVAQPLHKRIVDAAAESRSLAAFRDTLLPELISGRLRVRDAQRSVDAERGAKRPAGRTVVGA